jgi:hypothetical protein
MAELCEPELQASGGAAGWELFERLLSEATASDPLGRLLDLQRVWANIPELMPAVSSDG